MSAQTTVADRLLAIQNKTLEEEALVQCFKAVEELVAAIQTEAVSFQLLARQDRSVLRKEIVARHQRQHGMAARIDTSKRALFLRMENGRPRFTWHVAWYSQRGSGARFSSLKLTESGTALRDLLDGAHPDEIELLTVHEMTVRDFNLRWEHIVRIRRSVRMCAQAHLNARKKAEQAGEAAA